MRRTKIVATLGPATDSPAVLREVLNAGVDVVRLNAAHSGPGELATRLAAVREAEPDVGRFIGVLLDLPGPKLRVGEVEPETFLTAGEAFSLVNSDCVGDAHHACVTYAGLADDLKPGDRVLLDDGRIELEVTVVGRGAIETRVLVGGPLVSNKGINVPGVTLGVEPITRYDKTVLAWAQANDIDFIGQSFVRSARDVDALKELMTKRRIPVVAKIEKHEAVAALDAIIGAADAVMVARGDLGVETSPEEVPVVQRRIISAARAAGKPVVVATQMLDSMTTSPRPTRAEASDVANAIFERADASMLSGETAVGQYPVKAVETMARIAATAEGAVAHRGWDHGGVETADVQEAVSAAVCDLAADLSLAAIVPLTESGATAFAVARHRPDAPIVAATPWPAVARRLALTWGVQAIVVPFAEETDVLLDVVLAEMRSAGLVRTGERVAFTGGRATRTAGATDFIQVRNV
jgi:pyruvate kinase